MKIKVETEEETMRIDSFLVNKTDYSRSKIQKIIKAGQALVNGKQVNNSYKLKIDDVIELDDDINFDVEIVGEDIPLDVVYEDEYLMVINKESGMVVHPAPGNYTKTLVNALIGRSELSKGSESFRPGIVHRIDKDTSGLMVVAKDDKTHELLSEMIKNKEVERIYIALVDGVIMHDTGDIDAPIGRDPNNRQKMAVTDVNSKHALTHFRVLKRFKENTLIECILDTGRTHQIRVHMSYINYPIHNDPLYGKSKKTTPFGQFLHSASIRFIHPITKKEIHFTKKLPPEFEEYLKTLEEY